MFKYSNRRARVTLTPKGQKRYEAFYNYHYGFRPKVSNIMVMAENKLGMIFENRREWISDVEYNFQWEVTQ